MLAATTCSCDFNPWFFLAFAALTYAAVIPLVVMIYRDVEKRTGDGAKVAFAMVMFWPLGLYWWSKARKVHRGGPPTDLGL
ncbi:MAG: hypothetical protein QOJ80_114 [Mycobacterium sp.]|nr:hypothetical protein [Mycobacterium sp.]